MIILGDIGGTKSQFVAFEEQPLFDDVLTFENAQFNSFSVLLNALANEHSPLLVTACYLAVAGPIINHCCEMTNLNWVIDSDALKQAFPNADIKLINDLEATAQAAPHMGTKDLYFLQGEGVIAEENIAVMSVGTGLGQATLLWCEEQGCYRAAAGEGGHCDFAPHNETEIHLLQFLWKQSPKPACLDNIASGTGLITLLQFCALKSTDSADGPQLSALDHVDFDEIIKKTGCDSSTQLNAKIVRLAEQHPHSIYRQAVDLLCDLIANELGNMTLRSLCHGGAIVAGGMAIRILPFIQSDHFINRFADKDAFSSLLDRVPVAFCLNTKAPLIGLYQHFVASKINEP